MKIKVHYKSGIRQTFIVPSEIYVVEFQQIAEKIGGEVLKVEFESSSQIPRQLCIEENKI